VIRRIPFREWAWAPIVLAGLLLVYLPGLGNQLVFDDSFLGEDVLVHYGSLLPLRPRVFSYGTFVWVHALFGDGWWKQRIVNLAIHACVVLALWAFYREILGRIEAPSEEGADYRRSPALGLALGFFALNPVAVYAVAYLIQRSILLATLFVTLGLWLFARGIARGKPGLVALSVVCYALAVASKENALFAPLAALPVYILAARPTPRRLATVAGAGLVVAGIASLILWQRYGWIVGNPFDEYSHVYLAQLASLDPAAKQHAYGLSVLNEAWLFFRYGVDWLLPWSGWLSIDLRPPFPVRFATLPHALGIFGYVALVAGGFFLLLRFRDGRALLGLALLLPALLFPTEFVTIWVQDPFVLYRSYLWAIGLPGLVFFVAHGPSARVTLVAGLLLGALLVWQSVDRVVSLATPVVAWTDAIGKLPNDPRAVGRWFPYLNRGSAYMDMNDFESAYRDFDVSSRLGDLGMGAFNMGAIAAAGRKPREALALFDRAEKEGYRLYNLYFQRGLVYLALGRTPDAFRDFREAVTARPPSPTRELALINLGRTALQLGRRGDAIRALEELAQVDPGNREARYLLGMAYVMNNDPARAVQVLDRLLAQEASGPGFYARALANYGLKRKAQALSDIDNAIRMGPDNPALHDWRRKIEALP
jgi:tetratricopeptide (TPR) repeat protein